MTSLIASALLAAVIPTDFLDSVGTAAYWFKKDSRGRGDSISEQSKPKRFPAFAVAPDAFLVQDPMVRTQHLARIELWFGDKVYSAKESARGKDQDFVVLKTEEAVDGVKPLSFVDGDGVSQLTWVWYGDTMRIETSGIGTNESVHVDVKTRQPFYSGKGSALIVDKQRRPVGMSFQDLKVLKSDRYVFAPPLARGTVAADSFEKAACDIERKTASAALSLVFHLEQEDKDSRQGRRWRYDDDGPSSSEFDAMGVVINGRVLVPNGIDAAGIARLKSVEAKFADGTKTNLVFAGALKEWKALVFDLPKGFETRCGSLVVSAVDPHTLFAQRGWSASIENEAGNPIAVCAPKRFEGVEFLKGAKFVASVERLGQSDIESSRGYRDEGNRSIDMILTDSGEIAAMLLSERFGERYSYRTPVIAPCDLIDALAGKVFDPELRPRGEEDRNRIVWLGVETVELTSALAREKNAQSFCEKYSRPPLVTEVYPGSPIAKAGIVVGDILLSYRRGNEEEHRIEADYDYSGRNWPEYFESSDYYSYYGISATPWSDVENGLNRELTKYGAGSKITIVYVRDGKRNEVEVTLESAPPHYKNAPKARNRTLGILVRDMTFEVRSFFKFDDNAPGVVIAKIKPGSPAAVAGLKVYELITEVNGEKVTGAKDFAAKIKDKKDLVFAVRRLSQTRMVKIHVK